LDKEEWPKPELIEEAHKFIREWLAKNVGDSVAKNMRIQYSGCMEAN